MIALPVMAVDCVTNPSDPLCATSVVVSATVPSKVSGTLSTVTTNLTELPADGVSSVLITVTVKLVDGTAAANKNVQISSNRGNVDVFSVYVGANLQSGNQALTDANGVVKFTARSAAPGISTFTVVADAVILNSKPSVTFTPLPLLKKLIVSVEIPWKGQVVIFQPEKPRIAYPSDNKLVNTQIEIQIPFWVLVIMLLIIVSSPILFILLVVLFFKLRLVLLARDKQQEKEDELLDKIYKMEQTISQGQEVELAKDDQILDSEKEIKESVIKEVESE